jgi:mersacidin/lichenicidin family type 2 lantibiotic
MNKTDVVRAWKDPLYRATLTPDQLAALPMHPAGVVELNDDQIRAVSGGVVITTAMTCTENSFQGWKSCCPVTW